MCETKTIFNLNLGRKADILVLFLAVQMCCFHCSRGELTALSIIGKPVSQSSPSHQQHLYPAEKAVDGNVNTFAHTDESDPHPWWKVDLGSEHCLGNITVVLRQDCCDQYRFTGTVVRAGLGSNYAENQPCGSPATRAQSATAATNGFLCDPPRTARYVSLDLDHSNPDVTKPVLQIGEVRVQEYAATECSTKVPKLKSANFKRLHKGGLIGNPNPLSAKTAKSLRQCAGYCTKRAGCFSFDFAQTTNQCHLHGLNSTDIEISPSDDFSIYVY